MKDMWRMRAPPIPLDYDAILDERFEGRPTNGTTTNRPPPETEQLNSKGTSNGVAPPASSTSTSQGNIKDQKALSLKDNLELFVSRCAHLFSYLPSAYSEQSTQRLAERLRKGEETISFDKDDDDTLDFVTAASNLRSYAYGIEGKTRWDVKGTLRFSQKNAPAYYVC